MDRPLSDLITEKSNGRKQRPGRKFGGNKVEASARPRKLQNDFPPAFRNRSGGKRKGFNNGSFSQRIQADVSESESSSSESGSSSSDESDIRMSLHAPKSNSSVSGNGYGVVISNLPSSVTESDILQLARNQNAFLHSFGGNIGEVLFKFDKFGASLGEAELRFKTLSFARKFVDAFNHKRLDGRQIQLTLMHADDSEEKHVPTTVVEEVDHRHKNKRMPRKKSGAWTTEAPKNDLEGQLTDYMKNK